MTRLSEITDELRQLEADLLDEETGELNVGSGPELWDRIKKLERDREWKIQTIGILIREETLDVQALAGQEKLLTSRRRVIENRIANWHAYLDQNMEVGETHTSPLATVSKKHGPWKVDPHLTVPKTPTEFIREKPVERSIDKVPLLAALKAGRTFEGVKMVRDKLVRVK